MDIKKEPVTLRVRTKDFALRIIRLYRALPKSGEASVIGKQILRSGTSVGAQYREAYRAKSPRDFINKMEGSLQELDETYLCQSVGFDTAKSIAYSTNGRSFEQTVMSLEKIHHSTFIILHL